MVMTEEEIARTAARRSAARRQRVTKRCKVCGAEFEGLTTKRYCSDRCRVAAARERAQRGTMMEMRSIDAHSDMVLTDEDLTVLPGEDAADYFERIRRAAFGDRVMPDDSVELIRQSRIERTNELMRALGWHNLVEEP